jgi:hypothetical protein
VEALGERVDVARAFDSPVAPGPPPRPKRPIAGACLGHQEIAVTDAAARGVLAHRPLPRRERDCLGASDAERNGGLVERVAVGDASHDEVMAWISERTTGSDDPRARVERHVSPRWTPTASSRAAVSRTVDWFRRRYAA